MTRAQLFPRVTTIGPELSIPFITDYCKRWELPVYTDGLSAVTWLGAIYRGGLRAVAGYRYITDEFPDDRYIYGFYGDGSSFQNTAMYALGRELALLPYGLIGSIHLGNTRMIKMALKIGFDIAKIDPTDRCAVVRSPKNAARLRWKYEPMGATA